MSSRSRSFAFSLMVAACYAAASPAAAQGPAGPPAGAMSMVDANGRTVGPVISVALLHDPNTHRQSEIAILRVPVDATETVLIRASDRGFAGQFEPIFFDQAGCSGRAFANPGLKGVKPKIAVLNGTVASPSLWVTKLPRGITTASVHSYRPQETGECVDWSFGEFDMEELLFVRDLTGFTPPFRLVP